MIVSADRKKRPCKSLLILTLFLALAWLWPAASHAASGTAGFSVTAGGVHAGSVNLVTNWAVVPPDLSGGKQAAVELLCLSSSSNSAQLAFWEPVAQALVTAVNTNHGWSNLVVLSTNGGWAANDRLVFWSRTNNTWQTMIGIGASTNTGPGNASWTNVIIVDTNGASGGWLATPRANDVIYRMSRKLEIDLTADGSNVTPTNTLGGLQTHWLTRQQPLYYGPAGQPTMVTLRGGQIGAAAFASTNRLWIISGSYR